MATNYESYPCYPLADQKLIPNAHGYEVKPSAIVPRPDIRQWALTQASAAMVNWKDVGEWIDAAEAIAQYVCNGKSSS